MAGVTVQLYVSVWVANELEGRGATGVTDSQGRLYLIVFVQGGNQVLSAIRTTASKSGWTILSESGTSSSTREYISPSYVMMVDTDGNGIADQNEYALAAKFNPTMRPSNEYSWIAPEPVEIVGARSSRNLYGTLYNIADGSAVLTLPIYQIRKYGGGNWHLMIEQDSAFENLTSEYYKDLYAVDYAGNGSFQLRPGIEILRVHFMYAHQAYFTIRKDTLARICIGSKTLGLRSMT